MHFVAKAECLRYRNDDYRPSCRDAARAVPALALPARYTFLFETGGPLSNFLPRFTPPANTGSVSNIHRRRLVGVGFVTRSRFS